MSSRLLLISASQMGSQGCQGAEAFQEHCAKSCCCTRGTPRTRAAQRMVRFTRTESILWDPCPAHWWALIHRRAEQNKRSSLPVCEWDRARKAALWQASSPCFKGLTGIKWCLSLLYSSDSDPFILPRWRVKRSDTAQEVQRGEYNISGTPSIEAFFSQRCWSNTNKPEEPMLSIFFDMLIMEISKSADVAPVELDP